MSLEDIEKEIYRSDGELKKRRQKKTTVEKIETKDKVAEKWSEEETVKPVTAQPVAWWAKRIIISGVIFGVLLVSGAILFIFYSGGGASSDVGLQIYAPNTVYAGTPMNINLDISNSSQDILKGATLTLTATDGLLSLDAANNSSVYTESVGDIGIGSLSKKSYKFLAVGNPNTDQKITATLDYTLASGGRYETNKTIDVLVQNPSIQITFKKPDQILNGSNFTLEVDYANNSSFSFPDVVLNLQYPDNFQFSSASLTPTSLNDEWDLGELSAGANGSLTITGVLNGAGGSAANFTATAAATFNGQSYQLATAPLNLSVAASPISLQVTVNGRTDYIARLGDHLSYAIQYENLSGIALANLVLTATLSGEMFDYTSLNTTANVNGLTNQLTWNAANTPALLLVDPGGGGSVNFDINLKNQFPIQRLNDKNFSLHVAVDAVSPSVPYYLSANKTEATMEADTKVAGLISVGAEAFYRDADSGILNTGNLPPEVGKATQYTIHWLITNYSTDADNVTVTAALASGVSWTGQVQSNIDSVPLYDPQTGIVTWNIPKVIATKGVLDKPVEAVFQVSATPDAGEVGQYEPLLGETNLTATDDFTGITFSSTAPTLSTDLTYDPTVGQNSGRVIQ